MNQKPFDIPSITDSLRRDLNAGIITIEEAATELHLAGWTTYIDIEHARRVLA
jgi:hypothetical protein